MNNQLKVFKIGQQVKVKSDVWVEDAPWRQETVAVVLEHRTAKPVLARGPNGETQWVDNVIQFPNGEVEPFGNWELEAV